MRCADASLTMRSISACDRRPLSFFMVMFLALPVLISLAVTFNIPLASRSKVTSIFGTPRGAGASISIVASELDDNVRLARSAAVRKRRKARGCVSPAVARTSNNEPSSMVKIDTSKVPPPRSNINTLRSPFRFLSKPYAKAAAVGSLIILNTFRPAIAPASFVACRCESLKYAGTVTTASLTV
uniref:Uncharacterized protein n=1 Tax=Glossina palpalis gambiensis TaxID=67801 RepID=A0A1B0BJQ7_9MUSC